MTSGGGIDTVLVTGGAGFIGCNFVRLALARDATARVVVLDKLTYAGHRASLADVAGAPALRVRPRRHRRPRRWCAACSPSSGRRGGQLRRRDPRRPLDRRARATSCRPTSSAPSSCSRRRARTSRRDDRGAASGFRFLHVSTDEVYGTLGADGAVLARRRPTPPTRPTRRRRRRADHLVRAYSPHLRPAGAAHQLLEQLRAVPVPREADPADDAQRRSRARPLPIYGDGGNVRDWLYVEDHCRGILLVLERGRAGREVQPRRRQRAHQPAGRRRASASVLEEQLPGRRATRRSRARRHRRATRELKRFVADRPGHDRRYAIDAAKVRARARLGAAHDFEDGLAAHGGLVPRPTPTGARRCRRAATGASGSAWRRLSGR